MYIQKRKSLEDRINQVIHRMMNLPEEHFVVSIHLEKHDAKLPMESIRSKREEIIDEEIHGSLEKKPRTEIRGTLISLYEELFLVEKEHQEQMDEARFKHLLFDENLSSEFLVATTGSFIDALVGDKKIRTSGPSVQGKIDTFGRKKYNDPFMLKHTENQIALYNRMVETSRNELKEIGKRYPSETLQRWKREFEFQREEERRQLQMTLN